MTDIHKMAESSDKVYRIGELILDERFWDCECEGKYIHSKAFEKCLDCGRYDDEMPDARADEITAQNLYSSIDIEIAKALGYEVK